MGSLFKRGRYWYVDVRVKGRRLRKRIGPSKRDAELVLSDLEVKVAKEEFGFLREKVALEAFFDRFIQHSITHHRPKTTERYRNVIDHFRAFLEAETKALFLSDVTREIIDRYKAYRKGIANGTSGRGEEMAPKPARIPKSNTLNFELDTLRLIFNRAIEWDHLSANPVKGTTRFKVEDAKAPRFLSPEECGLLLQKSSGELRPIFFAFLNTGMRKAELENLKWSDVDLKHRQISIRFKDDWKPKSGERVIPINDDLQNLLVEFKKRSKQQSPGDYVFMVKNSGHSRNWLRDELIRTAREAGISNLTMLHTLRHTFASRLVMAGVDLPTVQKLMGHSDIETTMIYSHLAQGHLAEAVNKLQYSQTAQREK